MKDSFENNPEDPDNKLYSEGYAARVHGKTIKEMPSFEPNSPEAKAWLHGYHEARPIQEQEEIAMLENIHKK